jgi:peptidyl-prolyl cis-trans isomerase B (cyclophilin B)
MRNPTKLLLTILMGLAVLTAALGCGDSKDPSTTSDSASSMSSSTGADASKAPTSSPTADASSATSAAAPASEPLGPDDQVAAKDLPKAGEKVAVITTNYGQIIFKFLPKKAPKTVANFETLAGKKFYDETRFHRVIPGFMIQGGDPNTRPGGEANGPPGTGGPGYTIKDEFNDTHHERGIVSMAHTGQPDSAGSQFFICVGDEGFLDNKYAAFGKVVKGMNVVDKIVGLPKGDWPNPQMGDRPNQGNEAIVKSVRIETWPLK